MSLDSSQLAKNWLWVCQRFGARSTGENAGFSVSSQTPASVRRTSLIRILAISEEINEMQRKTAE
jgi:hypothetical protein